MSEGMVKFAGAVLLRETWRKPRALRLIRPSRALYGKRDEYLKIVSELDFERFVGDCEYLAKGL